MSFFRHFAREAKLTLKQSQGSAPRRWIASLSIADDDVKSFTIFKWHAAHVRQRPPQNRHCRNIAQKICVLDAAGLPKAVRAKCEALLIDVVGLAITARNEDYVRAVLAA